MQIHEKSFRYYFAMNIPVSIATSEFLTAEQLLERWGMGVLNAVGLVCTSARWVYHLMLSWSENFCKKVTSYAAVMNYWKMPLAWRYLVSCFSTFQRFGGLWMGFETLVFKLLFKSAFVIGFNHIEAVSYFRAFSLWPNFGTVSTSWEMPWSVSRLHLFQPVTLAWPLTSNFRCRWML